jgi:hypothetical protein
MLLGTWQRRLAQARPTEYSNGPTTENYAHTVALHFMYYNFVRIHQSLKITPAMAAKVTDRLWEIGDIVDVLEFREAAN